MHRTVHVHMHVHSCPQLELTVMKWLSVCLAFLSAALVARADEAENFASLSTNASTRVEQTLNGLFHYYWRNDPHNKKIQFFFACGQIGGGTNGADYGKCGCVNPSACVSCYRWWDAVALESMATHGIYQDTRDHSEIASTIFAHSPYNSDWNATATCTFIDDFSWYGIAYLRVYEWLQVCFYLFIYYYAIIINFIVYNHVCGIDPIKTNELPRPYYRILYG